MIIPEFDERPRTIEYQLKWEDLEAFKNLAKYDPHKALKVYEYKMRLADTKDLRLDSAQHIWTKDRPLAGLRIALDPGHIGGDLVGAKLEGKFVEMPEEKIAIFESELNWYTAKVLKNKLEKLGATVMMTRKTHKLTALDMTYNQWYNRLKIKKKPRKQVAFHRIFKKRDNDARIQKINTFQPDLTLIIHYNVDSKNTGWKKTTHRNNSMAFVGGSFMRNELYDVERRFNFLRLLLNDDVENSIDLAGQMLYQLDKKLGIKPIPPVNQQRYLE